MKVELIKEFYDYIKDWDIYLTYFGLHDLLREGSDWGIVYNDNSLKPSGVTCARAFQRTVDITK